jgi:hypothetical protein
MIGIVGNLMLAEIFALVYLPFVNIKNLIKSYPALKFLLNGLIFLLVSQILSDIYNNSAPIDYLRGWATIVFAIVSTIFLVRQLSNDTKKIIYYLGSIFLVRLFFGDGDLDWSIQEQNTNYFKTRFVGFLNPFILICSYFLYVKRKVRYLFFLFLSYGVFCIILDARSAGVIFVISSFIVLLKSAGIRLRGLNRVLISAIFVCFIYIMYSFYVNQVLNNNLGGSNSKNQVFKMSNPYNPIELLSQGRGEFFVLWYAAIDKPIFGHGSWAKDKNGKYAKLSAVLKNSKYTGGSNFIRAHSVILGFWTYAGIVGFLAILGVYIRLFFMLIKVYKSEYFVNTLPVLIVLGLSNFWDSLFSPIGHIRVEFPIFAALVVVSFYEYKNQTGRNV